MEKRFGSTGSLAEKIKLFSGPGTRQSPRFPISEVPFITGVSSNTGSKIKVANISRGGALLWTEGALAPRTRIHLNFSTAEGVIEVTGLVLRSSISSAKGLPPNHAAVAFDRPLQILDDLLRFDIEGAFYLPIQDSAVTAAFLAAVICNAQDEAVHEKLLNDW